MIEIILFLLILILILIIVNIIILTVSNKYYGGNKFLFDNINIKSLKLFTNTNSIRIQSYIQDQLKNEKNATKENKQKILQILAKYNNAPIDDKILSEAEIKLQTLFEPLSSTSEQIADLRTAASPTATTPELTATTPELTATTPELTATTPELSAVISALPIQPLFEIPIPKSISVVPMYNSRVCQYIYDWINICKNNFGYGLCSTEYLNIDNICKYFKYLSEALLKCDNNLLPGSKQNNTFKYNYDQLNNNEIPLLPQQKSIYFLLNCPNFKEMLKDCQELYDHGHDQMYQYNINVLTTILDIPKFILAFKEYIKACLYLYTFKEISLDEYLTFLITTLNNKTRNNYIIQHCNSKKGVYSCGRAIDCIITENNNTRIVIYNTNGTDDDYVDSDYFDKIKKEIH